ncbi:MAG: isopentenyl phosphate kinase [Patescibacteria group bacterium]
MTQTIPITLIKLGGSVVTFKNQAYRPRLQVLRRLIKEIKQAQQQTSHIYVIGHGQGSFAHIPAHKYQLKDGCQGETGQRGIAETRLAVIELNQIVITEFLKAKLPAVSLLVSQMAITKSGKSIQHDFSQLNQCLAQGLLPVTTGDVLLDIDRGCSIWSTEVVFAQLTTHLHQTSGYRVTRQVMVTDVPGVIDLQGQVIPKITPRFKLSACQLNSSHCTDVTGGMKHKVQSALDQTKEGIETVIVSGLKPGRLLRCLTGQACPQTVVTRLIA